MAYWNRKMIGDKKIPVYRAVSRQRIRILAPALVRGLLSEAKLGESFVIQHIFTPPALRAPPS